tara:strand:- start:1419 stop:1826 length:408 start_codon:yes stop_codon:yes gene_type:complete
MKLTKELMDYMVVFENLTRVHVKDCFENGDRLVFVVVEGSVMRAIGKNASNIKKLERLMKKKVKVVEGSSDPCRFVRSWIAPVKAESISLEDDRVVISVMDVKSKGLLLGRDRRNFKNLEEVFKRYFKGLNVEIR